MKKLDPIEKRQKELETLLAAVYTQIDSIKYRSKNKKRKLSFEDRQELAILKSLTKKLMLGLILSNLSKNCVKK